MEKTNEQALQEKYVEFQLLERQIKQIQAQIEQLESKMNELAYLQQSLVEMKDVAVGREIFVPIGAGIFLNAELKDNKDVLVNVGDGVVVKKSFESAAEILEKHVTDLRIMGEERVQKLAELSASASRIEQELSGVMGGD